MMSSLVKIVERPRRANAGLFSVCVVSFVLVAPSAFAWPDLRIVKSGPAQAAPAPDATSACASAAGKFSSMVTPEGSLTNT